MYILHYYPDNASLIIRLALEELGVPYQDRMLDRPRREQDGAAFRALNPLGLIPVLETPDGPLFETAAILLWLSETHGRMGVAPGDPQRGHFLKWLFYTSNTLHADLRVLFVPRKYAGPTAAAQELHLELATARLMRGYRQIDRMITEDAPAWLGSDTPSVLDCYLAVLLRWPQLYPQMHTEWFELDDYPALEALAERMEARPAARRIAEAEGLGEHIFTTPAYPALSGDTGDE